VWLPSNRLPVVPRVFFCGNVFSETLPSNEYTRHNMFHTLEKQWERFEEYAVCIEILFSLILHVANVS
jgi:hypothetical protein